MGEPDKNHKSAVMFWLGCILANFCYSEITESVLLAISCQSGFDCGC